MLINTSGDLFETLHHFVSNINISASLFPQHLKTNEGFDVDVYQICHVAQQQRSVLRIGEQKREAFASLFLGSEFPSPRLRAGCVHQLLTYLCHQ
ncbi:MAG: hypothetical protein CMB79_03745 [Filomicrobium sp.]|nr:hypothetical protein [Filomicrobium sp.]